MGIVSGRPEPGSNEQFRAASDAVAACFTDDAEVHASRSREFYNYVAEMVLDASEAQTKVSCPEMCPMSFVGDNPERELIRHWLDMHTGQQTWTGYAGPR